jgi:hypothetical protein
MQSKKKKLHCELDQTLRKCILNKVMEMKYRNINTPRPLTVGMGYKELGEKFAQQARWRIV